MKIIAITGIAMSILAFEACNNNSTQTKAQTLGLQTTAKTQDKKESLNLYLKTALTS